MRIHVRHAVDLLDDLADLLGQLAKPGEVGAEDLHLDRAVNAGQVVDLILNSMARTRSRSSGTCSSSSSRRASKSSSAGRR